MDTSRTEENRGNKWKSVGFRRSIDFVRVHDSKRVCVATAEHAALPEALKRALNIYPAPQSGTRCRRIANFINDIADQTQWVDSFAIVAPFRSRSFTRFVDTRCENVSLWILLGLWKLWGAKDHFVILIKLINSNCKM